MVQEWAITHPGGKGNTWLACFVTGGDLSSGLAVRSIWSLSAARPRSSVAEMDSGMVAMGVTWPLVPSARSVTRGARSLSRPMDRNVGFESSAVLAEVKMISSVVASVSFHFAVYVRSSPRDQGSCFSAWNATCALEIDSVPNRGVSSRLGIGQVAAGAGGVFDRAKARVELRLAL